MITLQATDRDDAIFIDMVTAILNNSATRYRPREIYLINIDHWFDRKWQGFSGKALGAVGRWNSILTEPPFDPSRVLSQRYLRTGDSASAYIVGQRRPLHVQQTSSHNLHKYIKQISESGLFLWYSGETKRNDLASVMLYHVEDESTFDFYASFKRADGWKVGGVRGMSRREAAELMKAPTVDGI